MGYRLLKSKKWVLLVGFSAWVLAAAALAESPLVPQKGPYLVWVQDQLVVRAQASGLKAPQLEWRAGGAPHNRSMKLLNNSLCEGRFPAGTIPEAYRIVDGDRHTTWHSLALPPRHISKLRFAAYGDNRSGYASSTIHRQILKQLSLEKPAFVLNTGDLVYRGNNESHWDTYFADGKGVFDVLPQFPVMGNHDKSWSDRFGQLFPMGGGDRNYYAFRYGPAYFIALDTTVAYRGGSEQHTFLKKQLEQWRDKSPIIITFHHPPFNGGKHSPTRKVIEHLVPLFEDYGVDLVLAGHDHNYQRIGPINGVTYIITGGGGGPLYSVQPHAAIKKYKVLHHYILFEVAGNKIHGTMRNARNIVEDSFIIDYSVPFRGEKVAHPKF